MRCPDCDYIRSAAQAECPRCRFREAMRVLSPMEPPAVRTAPSVPAETAPPVTASPSPAQRAIASERPSRGRFALAGTLLLALGILAGVFLYSRVSARTGAEQKIASIFAAADSPCRHGDARPCFDSINRIRELRDFPDASLLLGDYKIATYLRTVSGGDALAARWERNTITEPELLEMGDEAYAKNLTVCRSLWMYAQVKRDHVAVPQFIIGGAGS